MSSEQTDRELLELAAKAAGIAPVLCYESRRNLLRIGDRSSYRLWRPFTDDGDALRLAVQLHISIRHLRRPGVVIAASAVGIGYKDDRFAATRRAIVLAAAKGAK